MRIISRKTIRDFWQKTEYKDSEKPLREWYTEAKKAKWNSPKDIRAKYGNASILKNSRVVFNIKGNDYRLVVMMHYRKQAIYIRFVGTHKQYDEIDAEKI